MKSDLESFKEIIKKTLLASCTCNNGNGIVCVGCFYRDNLAQAILDAGFLSKSQAEEMCRKARVEELEMLKNYKGVGNKLENRLQQLKERK